MLFLQVVFWLAAAAFATPFVLYPVALFLLSSMARRRQSGKYVASVSLVVSVFNEAEVIREKIENALALDYPPQLLEILVISDASDDATDEIVSQYQSPNVRLCRQEQRLGKSAGLSEFCPTAQGDILVFTDANSMFRPDALSKLVRHFDNPSIGYTVGKQLYSDANQGASADSENVYWNIELKIKEWESRLSSVVGADGAIYALRKELFQPLAPEDINDFVLPLKVITQGLRGIFDPEAVCFEEAAPSFQGEFRRKYRIVNRSLRAVTKVPQTLNPFRVGWFAFQLWGHKVLRWLGPVFMILMLVSAILLCWHERATHQGMLYTILLGLQLAGYALAALYLLPFCRGMRLVYIAYYFLLVNVAAAVGIGLLLSGKTIGVWKPQR
ncbi:Poly-beta-1,6-N-acetyl-D-glucosamine synthase [Aureliella helgolandensis]|uniref:Poly-beta-1,6-N-acetyl-D-glucosamine synthase n=2 Tax=Aureliella helgolandensis TaxID=2527968 RepID=A0A518GE42_9BACT|nr:Poly-beta-1,6-N-acetyl-D-glucosamine synthase [Aureliella helgolandensis]